MTQRLRILMGALVFASASSANAAGRLATSSARHALHPITPQKYSTPRDGVPSLHAPSSPTLPVIDGVIASQDPEWADASAYSFQDGQGHFSKIRLKRVNLGPSGPQAPDRTCAIYPNGDTSVRIPCGPALVIGMTGTNLQYSTFFFDEGAETLHGSGSSDGVLTAGAEDSKSLEHGSLSNSFCQNLHGLTEGCANACKPWDPSPGCFRCAGNFEDGLSGDYCVNDEGKKTPAIWSWKRQIFDGWFDVLGSYLTWTWLGFVGNRELTRSSHGFVGFVADGYESLELIMPLRGIEAPPGLECPNNQPCYDLSDVTIWPENGHILRLLTTGTGGNFPANGDMWDSAGWATLSFDP